MEGNESEDEVSKTASRCDVFPQDSEYFIQMMMRLHPFAVLLTFLEQEPPLLMYRLFGFSHELFEKFPLLQFDHAESSEYLQSSDRRLEGVQVVLAVEDRRTLFLQVVQKCRPF